MGFKFWIVWASVVAILAANATSNEERSGNVVSAKNVDVDAPLCGPGSIHVLPMAPPETPPRGAMTHEMEVGEIFEMDAGSVAIIPPTGIDDFVALCPKGKLRILVSTEGKYLIKRSGQRAVWLQVYSEAEGE